MTKITRRSAVASGLALAATKALPARAADMEIRFYYPIAVSGPITKLIDGYGADFEKENPGRQDQADLCGRLRADDRQGADRREGRRHPRMRHPARRRHHHAHGRGRRDPARRPRQDAARQGLVRRLLSGLHGECPPQGEDLRHSVPALDPGALLEQGGLPGSGARSRERARGLGRDGRLRQEAHEEGRFAATSPNGGSKSPRTATPPGCSRGSPRRMAFAS